MMHDTMLQEQFHQILEQHKGIMFSIARTYCRNESDRQDLLQEMLMQIWISLGRYNGSFAMSTWLYRICLNTAISFYRKNIRKKNEADMLLFDENMLFTDEQNGVQNEQLQMLQQFIRELNDLDKALIILYLEDKSYAEISDIMGLSVSNIGTKLGRIREKLKKKFAQSNG
jgi:RNA polymerase sigma-70 factor (ECF subfamily)